MSLLSPFSVLSWFAYLASKSEWTISTISCLLWTFQNARFNAHSSSSSINYQDSSCPHSTDLANSAWHYYRKASSKQIPSCMNEFKLENFQLYNRGVKKNKMWNFTPQNSCYPFKGRIGGAVGNMFSAMCDLSIYSRLCMKMWSFLSVRAWAMPSTSYLLC